METAKFVQRGQKLFYNRQCRVFWPPLLRASHLRTAKKERAQRCWRRNQITLRPWEKPFSCEGRRPRPLSRLTGDAGSEGASHVAWDVSDGFARNKDELNLAKGHSQKQGTYAGAGLELRALKLGRYRLERLRCKTMFAFVLMQVVGFCMGGGHLG